MPTLSSSRRMPEPHELLLRVRYSETDQMRIVHHASYLIYMEEGRTALMRALGFPYEGVERSGFAMAVRKVDLRYRVAARYGDQIVVRTWVERFRGASIQYRCEIARESDQEVVATGSAEVACLRLEDFAPTPLPEDIRAALERYLAG
ncbi:MAG: acyl-CoA thioesterase [Planctomycetes bacterium]|nr:acyl-CoA thioesterase [Planctomycetota bacterium]